MQNKCNIILIFSILFLTSWACSKSTTDLREDIPSTSNKENESQQYFTREWISVHDTHNIDTSLYDKFQLFDFCKLKGFGKIEKEPYILMRDSAEFKIVRRSDDLYNPYIFQNMGDYWYNYKAFYMEWPRDAVPINGPWPAEVHRFIKNNVMFEYYVEFIGTHLYPRFRVFSDIFNCHVISLWTNTDQKEYEKIYSAGLYNELLTQYKQLSKQKSDNKDYYINNYSLLIKYDDPHILEYNAPTPSGIDCVLYSPLGEIDDDCTKPRCFANKNATIRDTFPNLFPQKYSI